MVLSRVSNINNPYFLGEDNVDATTQYNSLGEWRKFDPGSTINANTHSLQISLLNTRSLRGHAADNSKHKTLKKKWYKFVLMMIKVMYAKNLELLQLVLTCVEGNLTILHLYKQKFKCCLTSAVSRYFCIRY